MLNNRSSSQAPNKPGLSENISRLSEQQIACLRLVAELKKTEQIAEELNIAPSTVNTHIERAMSTLGVRSRREAARQLIAATAEAAAPKVDTGEGESNRARTGATAVIDPSRERQNPPADRPDKSPTEFPRLSEQSPPAPATSPAVAVTSPPRNTLGAWQRLGLGLLALVLLCLAVAGLGAAIQQLSEWRSGLASARR